MPKRRLHRYKRKLIRTSRKVRILENMVEDSTRELYLRNQELERKNKELEQFTYISSHDLQEPLRTVSSFVELMADRYAGRLDETAETSLRFIREATRRMQNQIRGLLDYSRLGTAKEEVETDCNRLVRDVLADLATAVEASGAAVEVEALPTLHAYEHDLRMMFQNLIGNAVKFRRPAAQPRIRIWAEDARTHWRFAVADNGIGIAAEHGEKVFTIFQRLHGRAEYEGTGIGLAHCKKIAALHDGEVWFESTPGAGTTFYFTIKAKPSETA